MEDARVEARDIRDRKLLVALEFEKRAGSILPDNVAEKLKMLAEVDIKISSEGRSPLITYSRFYNKGEDEENMPKAADFGNTLKKALTD